MLRKVGWTALGIAGLSLLLCGGCTAEAQSDGASTQETRQAAPQPQAGTTQGRQASGQTPPPDEVADLWDSVAELRAQVAELRSEVTELREVVAESAQAGVGGSGTAGTGDASAAQGTGGAGTAGTAQGAGAPQQGTGGAGTAGTAQGATGAQGTGGTATGTQGTAQGTGGAGTGAQGSGVQTTPGRLRDVPPAGTGLSAPRGTAVVNAIYTGVVSSVAGNQVTIKVDGGGPVTLNVEPETKVLRDGKRLRVDQLEPGEPVRAVVDLVGPEKTLEIAVQPEG